MLGAGPNRLSGKRRLSKEAGQERSALSASILLYLRIISKIDLHFARYGPLGGPVLP